MVFIAVAACFGAISARAADCGDSASGFGEWLTSFKQVAIADGVSPGVVETALAGVAYDPAVKAHDHGVAAFGSNAAGFAASLITPGRVMR